MKLDSLNWLHHLYASELSTKAKLAGAVIMSYAYSGDEAFPGLSRLAFETSLSRRSVQNAIAELEREGWLLKKSGGRVANGSLSPNRYRRGWPSDLKRTKNSGEIVQLDPVATVAIPIAPDAIPPMATDAIPMVTDAIPMATGARGVVHQLPPKEKVERESKEKERGTPPKVDPLTMVIDNRVDPTAWAEWCEHKHSGKKIAQSTATKMANQFLLVPSSRQQEMVDYSIANSYKGIFPDRFKGDSDDQRHSGQKYGSARDTAELNW